MNFLLSVTFIALRLILTPLAMADNKFSCMEPLNEDRKDAKVEEWKMDEALQTKFSGQFKKCLTETEMKSVEGFTVARTLYTPRPILPNSFLVAGIKKVTCIEFDCDDESDVVYYFLENGGLDTPSKSGQSVEKVSKTSGSHEIQNIFFMIGISAVLKLF